MDPILDESTLVQVMTWRRSISIAVLLYVVLRYIILHYNDVIMSTMASQITGVSIVCSTVGLGADQRKPQSSGSLAFVRGIHREPLNSRTKGQ